MYQVQVFIVWTIKIRFENTAKAVEKPILSVARQSAWHVCRCPRIQVNVSVVQQGPILSTESKYYNCKCKSYHTSAELLRLTNAYVYYYYIFAFALVWFYFQYSFTRGAQTERWAPCIRFRPSFRLSIADANAVIRFFSFDGRNSSLTWFGFCKS